ncbi:beta propeller repeat protein [Archangium lipolyticum]|uniref:hypothetical protein n=1 Tax=Archangium lipolyticum TaxID=2970465 RepID=UPI002149E9F2|nr:hypothetical protein [Archangium lipolyticum]
MTRNLAFTALLLPVTVAALGLLPACGSGPDTGSHDAGTDDPPDAGSYVEACPVAGVGSDVDAGTAPDAGATPDAGSTADAGCVPLTCARVEANCGPVPNGCGGTLDCGTCSAPETCGGRGKANTCAIPAADRWCNEGGWCWEYPVPHGYALFGAHFSAANDGWAVGEAGHIQRWNGTKWARVSSGTSTHLYDVHAVSATDVWTVGRGGIALHSSGGTFSPVASGTNQDLRSLWASGPNDVWAVGTNGTVRRNQGSGFQPVDASTTQTLNGVWGSGPGDVWAVGNGGTVRHHDGTTFSSIDAGTALPLYEVTGSSPSDVWAVTSEDPCLFCNDYGIVYRVSTAGLSEALHIDDQLFHVFAAGPSAVLTVGESSRYRWNGAGWQKTSSGYNGVVAGSGPNDAWLLGTKGLTERWNGTQWTVQTPRRDWGDISEVHGSGATNVWAVESNSGNGRLLHWTGGGWVEQPLFSGAFPSVSGLYVASPSAVWVTTSGSSSGDHRIYRWNGTAFTQELSAHSKSLLAIHGSSQTDVWAVGWGGIALHNDGSGWGCQPTGTGATLQDVWVQGPSLAIAVGESGTILRWNGTSWSTMLSGTRAELRSVWGSGPSDIWAAGANGTLLHYNGAVWLPVSSGTTATLNSLWGASSSAVWAVGEDSTLLRYDGSRWTAESTGTQRSLQGVWAASPSDVWVVGESAILHKP